MAISILLVDDDKLLVQKLYETVNWEKLGIEMVFTASNIRQARKLLKDYPIELLLCDIDMPQGSGLELLEWIRNNKMDIECAFLSSYANFAYAQMALKLSSREYLLKPISNSDLEYALSKMVDVVKEKTLPSKGDDRKKTFWKELLKDRIEEKETLSRALAEGLYGPEDRICMDMVKIRESSSRETLKKDIALYDFVMQNSVGEFFEDEPCELEAVVHMTDLEWMLVFRLNGEETVKLECFEGLKAMLDKDFVRQCFIYAGAAGAFSDAIGLRDNLEYMEENAVPDRLGILFEENWTIRKTAYQTPPWDVWEKEMVHSASLLLVQEKMMAYVEERKGNGYLHMQNLKRFVHELTRMLYKYLNDQNLEFDQIFDMDAFEDYRKAAYCSMGGLDTFTHYIFETLDGNRQNDSRQENILTQLEDYIDQHLGENLSRSVLAKHVYLSEDYISKVFVRLTGMSIPSYIAGRRIDKAKEYIQSTSLPISKIALEVGYSNFSYFSKTFRDLVGCTPNEYRNRNNNKNQS